MSWVVMTGDTKKQKRQREDRKRRLSEPMGIFLPREPFYKKRTKMFWEK